MKTYKITITGSGTLEEIENALIQLRWDINYMARTGEASRDVHDKTLTSHIEEVKP